MPPTVHHLRVSQSERIVWLCEELGIDYRLSIYDRSPLLSPAELAALTPQKSAPVLTDTNVVTGKVFNMSESGAIVEYIINVYGDKRLTLSPTDANYPDYLFWLHFANGTLQPTLGRLMFVRLSDGPATKMGEAGVQKCLAAVEARLNDTKEWLAGPDFTCADVMTVWCFTTMRRFCPYDITPYPAISAYLQRVAARPQYRAAMTKGEGADHNVQEAMTPKGPPVFPALVDMQRQLSQAAGQTAKAKV